MQTPTATLEPTESAPDLELMPRANVLTIWNDFATQLEKLKTTAETLTVTDVSQVAEMKLARQTRLALKELRVEIDKKRKELGEEALRRKQRIDSDAKTLREAIEPLEARLLEQEQYAERVEAERVNKLVDARMTAVFNEGGNPNAYNFAEMSEEDFTGIVESLKLARQAREEAARKEAEERAAREKAEAEERERIRIENERLKAEAEKREAEIAAERAKAEAERKEQEAKAEAERAKLKAEAEAAAEKARSEAAERERIIQERAIEAQRIADENARAQAAKADAERKAREKAEAELKAKQDAEAAAAKAKADAEKKAAQAPDKAKLAEFANTVRAIQCPAMSTPEGKVIMFAIRNEIDALAESIEDRATGL